MYRFRQAFVPFREVADLGQNSSNPDLGVLAPLWTEYGGKAFNDGIYRIFTHEESQGWTQRLRSFFGGDASRVLAFGRDWQGNLFGFREGEEAAVLLFQPGTGEVFEVAASLDEFHDVELVEHPEEALSYGLWREWRAHNQPPGRGQCVGYVVPIFLGGEACLANLIAADLELYWDVLAQLWEQVRALPEGAPIERIELLYLDGRG